MKIALVNLVLLVAILASAQSVSAQSSLLDVLLADSMDAGIVLELAELGSKSAKSTSTVDARQSVDHFKSRIDKNLRSGGLNIVAASRPGASRLVVTFAYFGDMVMVRARLYGLTTIDCKRDKKYSVLVWERERFMQSGRSDLSFVADTLVADYKAQKNR